MGAIIALLKKDLYNLSSYKTSLIIILILVPIFCISISDIQFIIPALTMMLGMIAISTFSYDDMSKANKYINAMPCTKKEVVRGKYILAIMGIFLGGAIGTIVTIIVGNIINIVNPSSDVALNCQEIIINAITWMTGLFIIQSIQIPLIYKYGAEKSRIVMIMLMILAGGIIVFVEPLIPAIYNIINIQIPQNLYTVIIGIGLALLVSVMYIISFKISYKTYKNKEA